MKTTAVQNCGNYWKKNTLCHYPSKVGLYLNCCYAINIVSKMTEIDALESLKSFASPIVDDDDDDENIVSCNDDAATTIVKAYYGDQRANDRFQECYIRKLGSNSLHVKHWSN